MSLPYSTFLLFVYLYHCDAIGVQRKMISLNYEWRLQIEGPLSKSIITGPVQSAHHFVTSVIETPRPMSLSPPVRRLSSASSVSSSKREEDLINAYEAEEERIINVLSRKLEKVRLYNSRGVRYNSNVHARSSRKRRLNLRMCSRQSQSHT